MRQVSEHFKECQNEIIRPALSRIVFAVKTDIATPLVAPGGSYNPLNFDTNVAPVVAPKTCRNQRLYAIVGENVYIDNPMRMCAPDKSGGSFAEPNQYVPYGVTAYANANEEVIIGSSLFSLNFTGITTLINLQFKGGHIPHKLVVEYYDKATDTWKVAGTYTSATGSSSWWFRYNNPNPNLYTRFKVSAPTAGRFQLSYLMCQKDRMGAENTEFSFVRSQISKISINQEVDLTAQSLPTVEATVEALDVDGIYTPDSDIWREKFKSGTPCYVTVSYDNLGFACFADLIYGKLTEEPDYSDGKLTFKVAFDWRKEWNYTIDSVFDDTLSVGDEVPGDSFYYMLYNSKLFDGYEDAFIDADDRSDSVCNYSGEIDSQDARQLIANALGCHIKTVLNVINLENTNNIQYKPIDDYLTRYNQVKCTLESKPKVGKISVAKTLTTVTSDYIEVTSTNAAEVGTDAKRFSVFFFDNVPFFATGKWELVNAQSTNPDATVTLYSNPETVKKADGSYQIGMPFGADEVTTIQPIVRFYKTESAEAEETEILDEDTAGEVYENNNVLVTNSYVAGKVNRVAHLVSDISNQYEVDVVQDLRYEVGDVIRLETEKNVYKTCVITGLKFNLPGCNGHLTCRKIFSLLDGDYIVEEPKGLSLSFGVTSIEVDTASEVGCVVGIMNTQTTRYIYVLGVETYEEDISGTVTSKSYNASLTDNNNHEWKFAYYTVPSGVVVNTSAPVVNIPEYDASTGASEGCFGAVALLKTLYAEQDMNAPADYTNDWEVI